MTNYITNGIRREKSRAKKDTGSGNINESLWLQAEKVLDPELFAELQQSVIHLMDMEACHEFQEGFRLGAQLMLDIQRSAAPQP